MEERAIDIGQLIARYIKGESSAKEINRLQALAQKDPDVRRILDHYKDTPRVKARLDFLQGLDTAGAWAKVRRKTRHKPLYGYIGYVAGILLFLTASLWGLWPQPNPRIIENATSGYKNDIAPGGNQAILTLSDGKRISLGADKIGIKEADGSVAYTETGELSYFSATQPTNQMVLMNTLTVPKAGKYRLILPDSSIVWLNSQSAIEFPVHFNQTERLVRLKGEAYFDVAHDPDRPFKIAVNGQEIQVLGTSFNVSAYDQSTISTTVVNGRVNVKVGDRATVVEAGQEATSSSSMIIVTEADIEKAIAWKNGQFYFNEDYIQDILTQLARWYDLDVTYETPLPKEKIGGSITRDVKLSQVLEMLTEISGVSFEIDGQTLIVKKDNL